MTRSHALASWTQWWIDSITDTSATLVRLSPALRRYYARAELADQLTLLKRLDSMKPPQRNERRLAEVARQVAVLRRFLCHSDPEA